MNAYLRVRVTYKYIIRVELTVTYRFIACCNWARVNVRIGLRVNGYRRVSLRVSLRVILALGLYN